MFIMTTIMSSGAMIRIPIMCRVSFMVLKCCQFVFHAVDLDYFAAAWFSLRSSFAHAVTVLGVALITIGVILMLTPVTVAVFVVGLFAVRVIFIPRPKAVTAFAVDFIPVRVILTFGHVSKAAFVVGLFSVNISDLNGKLECNSGFGVDFA